MKQGWEIKKLGDISVLITDGDWIESRHQSDDGIRLIQTGNIGNGIFRAKDAKSHYISEETFNELGCTEIFSGDCLVSRLPEPVGRACIIPELDYRMITAVDCTIIRFKDFILPKFFVYYSQCSKYLRDINNSTTGTTRKRISRKNLESVTIPIPSILEQEKIVAELDCLSGIIEKKKQQLKEYDALAHSIFYEMFGNPIDNEKGWEMKKVIDVVKLQRGYDLPTKERVQDGDIPVWGSNGIVGYHNVAKINFGIVTGRSGTLGIVYSFDKPFFPLNTTLFSIDTHGNNIVYLRFLLNRFDLKRFGTGTGVPTLNRNTFHNEKIINVPLALQQEFALKIESVEEQKELIKQSIAETETLFNSRMDYYFS